MSAPPSPPAAAAVDADDVTLVSLYEKARKIYPRAVGGVFARWRWGMVALTQLLFYGMPWLQWNGRQAVLFDLEARRFYVGGLVLLPQDLIYLAGLLVVSALGLFFFTAIAGRLWCGYACPQTVYTEMFLWIERHTEGDRTARMALDAAPWSAAKLGRKSAKHGAWLLLALVTGVTFVGYFTPMRALVHDVATLRAGPWEAFWILFYAFATYGNAGWMREQICKYMCPYARFQSTLIDGHSMVIAYDVARGEPRGARPRRVDPKARGLGDCIQCTLCVQVCPTGIDIRDGLQNECIGCAACIDVCDDVMGKMGYAPGLIRYATADGAPWRDALRKASRPRVWVYGVLLVASIGAMAFGLSTRSALQVDVIRDRGALARVDEQGRVENTYRLQVANRAEAAQRLVVAVEGLPATVAADVSASIDAAGQATLPVHLTLDAAQAASLAAGSHKLTFVVTPRDATTDRPGRAAREASTFIVPR